MRPVPAVLAVVQREDRVLLVRRANPPDQGLWGFPGGKVDWGETLFAAAQRELREETGLDGSPTRVVTAIDVLRTEGATDIGGVSHHFVLIAIACDAPDGEALASDDALEAAWFPVARLEDGDPAFSPGTASLARLNDRQRRKAD